MLIESITIDNLKVNRANDRHGELSSEQSGIEWLLKNRKNHMRNITKDLVASGEIYEPPLVRRESGRYVVYDGNRRTTAMKLLQAPEKSPTEEWAKFFRNQRKAWPGDFPVSIFCQVEQDRDRIDEILYRRHTGQQSGVGQSQWDNPAKTNFERRTGKKTKLDVAEEIEKYLFEKGLLEQGTRLPRSNLRRLLSAEQFRNRVGISIRGDQLKVTHNEDVVLKALKRIADDLVSKKVTLDDIWAKDKKTSYLDTLELEGLLPKASQVLDEPTQSSRKVKPKVPSKPGPSRPEIRNTLIRLVDHGIAPTHSNRRHLDIFDELQNKLTFEHHCNAISVLFRVLLEISMENYISQRNLSSIHSNDKLSLKFSKIRDDMNDQKLIDKKYRDLLKRFDQNDVLVSAHTMNSYVHSSNFFPSETHLKSLWDTLEKFVVTCLKV